MQKDPTPLINCPLSCMNWYSWGVIRSLHCIHIHSHRICIVVKFYNHKLRLWYGCILMQYFLYQCFLNENVHQKSVLIKRRIHLHQPLYHTHMENEARSFYTVQTCNLKFHSIWFPKI